MGLKIKSLKQIIPFFIFAFLFILLSFLKDPWHDELFTRYLMKKNFIEIFSLLKNDSGPPLYYFLLKFFTFIFGTSIFSLRCFSAILVLLSGLWIKKILNNINMSSSLYYLFYLFAIPLFSAAEARNYSLVLFLSSLFFYEILGKERKFPLILYSTLLNYTHYISFFYIFYLISALIFEKKKKYFTIIIFVVILTSPLYFLIREQPIEAIDWTRAIEDKYSPIFFFSFFFLFFNINLEIFQFSIKYLIFSLIGYFMFFYSFTMKKYKKIFYAFLINLILIFLISFTYKYIYMLGKTQVFFFIPFFIFFMVFTVSLSERKKYLKFLILLLFSLLFFANYNNILIKDPFKPEILPILKLAEKDTDICTIGIWGLPTSYYLEQEGMDNNLIIFPPSQVEHLGWYYYKELNDKELEYFKKNILESGKKFVVFWQKNDPYSRDLIKIFPEDLNFYQCGQFKFFVLNMQIKNTDMIK